MELEFKYAMSQEHCKLLEDQLTTTRQELEKFTAKLKASEQHSKMKQLQKEDAGALLEKMTAERDRYKEALESIALSADKGRWARIGEDGCTRIAVIALTPKEGS